ncbi:MAG: hypothetical protein R2932_32110 [Caldilineaceae bacterium]
MNDVDQDLWHLYQVQKARMMIQQFELALSTTNQMISMWEQFERERGDQDPSVRELIASLSAEALRHSETVRRMRELEESANWDHFSELLDHHALLDAQAQAAARQPIVRTLKSG